MILDTSFLLDLKDGEQAAFDRAMELYDARIVQRVAMPSVMELYYGAVFLDDDEERRRVRSLLTMYPLVDLDERTALLAGELLAKADLREGGDSGVDYVDAAIAAAGERFGEPVLTRNVSHFERLGVEVETY